MWSAAVASVIVSTLLCVAPSEAAPAACYPDTATRTWKQWVSSPSYGIFPVSSNEAAWQMLHVGGLRAHNDLTKKYGTTTRGWGAAPAGSSAETDSRYTVNRWDPIGYVDFLYDLQQETLLSPALTDEVLGYAEKAPQRGSVGYANALVAKVPGGPYPQKHGWIPANGQYGRQTDGTHNGSAIFTARDGRKYALAIGIRDNSSYTAINYMANASRDIYDKVSSGASLASIQRTVTAEGRESRSTIDDIVIGLRMIGTGEKATYDGLRSGDGPLHRASVAKWMWVVGALQLHGGRGCGPVNIDDGGPDDTDEMVFYRGGGATVPGSSTTSLFLNYDMSSNARLGKNLHTGEYSADWTQIVPGSFSGDGKDEVLFYAKASGRYEVYQLTSDGTIGTRMQKGTYSTRWDQIVAMDVDGDGRDERMFYEAATGDYLVYRVNDEGRLAGRLSSGRYSKNWSSIEAGNIDTRDADDEIFFYRKGDGLYRYYNLASDGSIRNRFRAGNYSTGWSQVVMVDYSPSLQGTELLLYRSGDGRAAYYELSNAGAASNPTSARYSSGWSQIVAADYR